MTTPSQPDRRSGSNPDATPQVSPRGRDAALHVDRIGVSSSPSAEREHDAEAFAIRAARTLRDNKCEDVLVLDLRRRSQVTDFFVIASGSSDRQMRSAGQHVEEAGAEMGMPLYRSNLNEGGATWVVLDFVDVIVHIFEPQTRRFYDIEMLWGDADRLDWRRPGERAEFDDRDPDAGSRNRAGLRSDDVLP